MERLTLETLARLVDEAPTAEEQALLDADASAQRELEALRAQKNALAALPSMLPAEAWVGVKARLLELGLIRRPAAGGAPNGRGAAPAHSADQPLPSRSAAVRRLPAGDARASWRRVYHAAAAVILFAGGAAAGWTAAPAQPAGRGAAPVTAAQGDAPPPRSLAEARSAVQTAERNWLRAHDAYWQFVEASQPGAAVADPAARLAALEALAAAGHAAVAESPSDAYFNGFLMTTLAQRQQTLRQIGRAGGWY